MIFNLKLLIGTETIKFGMTSNEIKSILKMESTIHRHKYDKYDYENYQGMCNVFYEPAPNNGNMIAAAFHFFEFSQANLDGVNLIGKEKKFIEKMFKEKFPDYVFNPSSIESFQNRIIVSLNCENITTDVFIAKEGYTEQIQEPLKIISKDDAIAKLRKQASLR